ncbi:MAG TPA: cytochrome c biogenesis protein ResB [Thermomicrobiales bacterium]|nr:cytochrome c biogenesis protein ResB [Thermomicrobiales bacterium]
MPSNNQPARPADPTSKRGWSEIAIDRVWRFFCSVRAAIWEIAFLALLVLIGTLRGSSVPRLIADRAPITEPLVARWYSWDVFHSFLFMAVLALLSVAIAIGGMINRAPGIWNAIAHPTVATSHGFLHSARPAAELKASVPVSEIVQGLTTALKERRYRVLTESRGDEVHLYADRNRFSKLGTFPFHMALILILLGGIVGARFGFRETEFIVPEGEARPVLNGTDLSIRLDRFEDRYTEDGSPAEYTSHLTVLDDGKAVAQEAITVNHPLTYNDVVVYQASFGQAVQLRVTDPGGNLIYDGAVELGLYRASENPDAPAGVLSLPDAGVTLSIIAPDEAPLNQPESDLLRLADQQIYVKARYNDIVAGEQSPDAVLNARQTADLGRIQVEFVRETRFTLLQVARNPGIPIFVIASILLVGGLAITFYFPHRRLRGIIQPGGGGSSSVARLAPVAKRDWSGQKDFRRLLRELSTRLPYASVSVSEASESGHGGGSPIPPTGSLARPDSR